MLCSMRARSSGSSSCPKSRGVPSTAQCVHGRLVDPEQQALAFLAHVVLRIRVADEGELAFHRLDLGDRLGD